MHGASVFVDTNVIVYSRETAADPRIVRSRDWLAALVRRDALVLNIQVLNELTHVLFRKRQDLSQQDVFAAIDELAVYGTTPVTADTIAQARTLRLANGFSWWDCLLLVSAAELGCSHFLSEDLHDGQKIGAMTVVDPFLHDPADILGA